jgi:hypothetical protein
MGFGFRELKKQSWCFLSQEYGASLSRVSFCGSTLKMMRKICIYSAQVKLCRFGRNRKTMGIFAVHATVQYLKIRALRNMTKRHRNLSYNISLERYGCLFLLVFTEGHFDVCRKSYGHLSDQRSDTDNSCDALF